MPTYIALLRAVNVGGRVYKMAQLREDLTASGLRDVETHIQTGNVRVTCSMRSAAKVEQHLERVLSEGAGFDVPAIVFTPAELSQVYDDALHVDLAGRSTGDRRFVSFFKVGEAPSGEVAQRIAAWDAPGEAAVVVGRAVHIWIDGPMHEARLFATFKKPLAPGTNRNLKVTATLAERWGAAAEPLTPGE